MSPRDRSIVAAEFLAAQGDAELIIGKCADLRDELRQIAENERRGFLVDVEGSGSVTVIWRGTGRPEAARGAPKAGAGITAAPRGKARRRHS